MQMQKLFRTARSDHKRSPTVIKLRDLDQRKTCQIFHQCILHTVVSQRIQQKARGQGKKGTSSDFHMHVDPLYQAKSVLKDAPPISA